MPTGPEGNQTDQRVAIGWHQGVRDQGIVHNTGSQPEIMVNMNVQITTVAVYFTWQLFHGLYSYLMNYTNISQWKISPVYVT